MFEIPTARLRIIPLSLDQFNLYLASPAALESSLRLALSGKTLAGHELEAMRWLYDNAKSSPRHHLWYTCWLMVVVSANIAIGSLCFKGGPDTNGEVEIGYGIDPVYRNQGYITEAAEAMLDWALRQPDVTAVFAETANDNPASQRVCAKTGMVKSKQTASTTVWRIARPE